MRTTLDIPDLLFHRAKRAALDQNTTLKALVARGLEKELGISANDTPPRLAGPLITLGADSPLHHSMVDRDLNRDESEASELNEVYRRR